MRTRLERPAAEPRRRVMVATAVLGSLLPTSAARRQIGETTTLASVDSAGHAGNGDCVFSSISADGRYVVLDSEATNLVPGDSNGKKDVFVHDRVTRETILVSRGIGGVGGTDDSYGPARLSANGRFVAYTSEARNLVPDDTNSEADIFVFDCTTGTTTRANVDSAGNQALGGRSHQPVLDDQGRFLAFESRATNLVAGDTNGWRDIFVRDLRLGETTRVSVSSSGEQAELPCDRPWISGDGRYVAFDSAANNLVPGDTDSRDVFVHDRQTGETSLVSVSSSGAKGDGDSLFGRLSQDGRFVVFESLARNLSPIDEDCSDVFLHDRQTGQTTLLSVDSAGQPGERDSREPWVSANGRYVAFESFARLVRPYPPAHASQVYLRDTSSGETHYVSSNALGEPGDHWTGRPAMTHDARFVVFPGYAQNLVPGDLDDTVDVFVRDRCNCAESSLVYCTAKTTSSGCVPAIASTGVPSASAAFGFVVSARQVEPDSAGLLLYGTTGPAALPFGGGLLCVRPPLTRTAAQASGPGGSPPCAGVIELDLNAAGICNSIGAGYHGWMQGWFRDPGAADKTGLSDALEWTVCP